MSEILQGKNFALKILDFTLDFNLISISSCYTIDLMEGIGLYFEKGIWK